MLIQQFHFRVNLHKDIFPLPQHPVKYLATHCYEAQTGSVGDIMLPVGVFCP